MKEEWWVMHGESSLRLTPAAHTHRWTMLHCEHICLCVDPSLSLSLSANSAPSLSLSLSS